MMKRKWINVFIFCAISICCKAQVEGYNFYTRLDSINESGMYKILLSPVLNNHLKTDYSDVRIINANDKWVPHVLNFPEYEISNTPAIFNLQYFVKNNDKIHTTIIIKAPNLFLNNINVGLGNTEAERFCSLSGSNDSINWFVIKDSITINPSPTSIENKNNFKIIFPKSNYKFYRLIITNGNKDPYEIKEITHNSLIEKMDISKNDITINPTTIFTQKDSGKISYIKVSQLSAFHFDEIKLAVNGSKYFERRMEVFEPIGNSNSITNPGKLVQSFVFSNNSNLSFKLPLINAIDFYILIYNDDNLPLKITEVATATYNRYIKTYLEKGNSYRLMMDNEKAEQPNYDIATLNTNETEIILGINSIEAFPTTKEITQAKNNKWTIWLALAAGLLLLLLLTKKMITELNKKNTNDTI